MKDSSGETNVAIFLFTCYALFILISPHVGRNLEPLYPEMNKCYIVLFKASNKVHVLIS